MNKGVPTSNKVHEFFAGSDSLDHEVLRPLDHIKANWEITWDHIRRRYDPEDDSFAEELNILVNELAATTPPKRYHENEDALAHFVIKTMKWPIRKEKGRWIGADYHSILEQGGFGDLDQKELLAAAAGRVHAAIRFGQIHFDQMEDGHQKMLSAVLAIVLYHRASSA